MLALMWAVAVDPCAVVPEGATARDRDQAAVYLNIADDELAGGRRDTATVAYQEAIRRDPANARARAALARLCHETPADDHAGPDRFSTALGLMKAGRRREAAALFESIRLAEHETAASLLAGVCWFELGALDRARPLLREAAADPALADSATVFLGLIALRDDEDTEAADRLRAIAASSTSPLRRSAAEIIRTAQGDARAVASFLTEAGYDSNVALTPDGSLIVPSSRDGAASETVAALGQPFGRSGPFARAAGQYRKQFTLGAYDLGAVGGALGWRQGAGPSFATGEYAYDFFTLGAARYLSAHRLAAEGRWRATPRFSFAVAAFACFESFLQEETAGYSGTRLFAQAEAAAHGDGGTIAACAYHGAHDDARAASLTYWEHGPGCHAWLAVADDRGRLFVEADLAFRRYAAPDPLSGVDRRDRFLDGLGGAEWSLTPRWAARLTLTVRRATSTVPDYTYTHFTAMAGAVYTLAFF
jgi:tetratricopeptide (TPR) repeat protein